MDMYMVYKHRIGDCTKSGYDCFKCGEFGHQGKNGQKKSAQIMYLGPSYVVIFFILL